MASYTYLHPTFDKFCPTTPNRTGCGAIDISQPATIGGVPNPLALPQDLGGSATVNNLFRNIYFENISSAASGNAVESNFTYGADRFYSLTMRYRL